ncbi:MAG: crossover junction endodeoxyribonuclease RuvC [Minisyncoccia bacterium]
MNILGIDPGLERIGYGIISISMKNIVCVDYGVIYTDKMLKKWERFKKIENGVSKIIRKYKPKILAIENLYFFKNVKTAIDVSQVKGIILLLAHKKKLKIEEYTPLQVKMMISGYGRAEKTQIQKMIQNILHLNQIPKPDDAADALAIALCASSFKLNNPLTKEYKKLKSS